MGVGSVNRSLGPSPELSLIFSFLNLISIVGVEIIPPNTDKLGTG